MSRSLRVAVLGQLSLLELLDAADLDEGDVWDGASRLGEWERAVLRFAVEHHLAGGYAERVEQQLGCSATTYLQVLSGMLDRPEVLAAAPELTRRLRALRDRRQRLRALSRTDPQLRVRCSSGSPCNLTSPSTGGATEPPARGP